MGGVLAQLVERFICTEKVKGSRLLYSKGRGIDGTMPTQIHPGEGRGKIINNPHVSLLGNP